MGQRLRAYSGSDMFKFGTELLYIYGLIILNLFHVKERPGYSVITIEKFIDGEVYIRLEIGGTTMLRPLWMEAFFVLFIKKRRIILCWKI